jgi:hypothetical protein
MALNLDSLVKLALVLRFKPADVSPRLASTIDLIAKLPGAIDSVADSFRIPVISGSIPVTAKAILDASSSFELDEGDFGLLTIYSSDLAAYGLVVSGNQLSPRFRNGEVLVIEPGRTYQAGDEVLVRLSDGRCMLKEFIYRREGQCRLDGLCGGNSMFIADEAIQAVHYVDAIVKGSRWQPHG